MTSSNSHKSTRVFHFDKSAEAAARVVLRPPDAAAYTGLSESTLAKRRVTGAPPKFLKLGGRAIGYAVSDLNEWLSECRRSSTSDIGGDA